MWVRCTNGSYVNLDSGVVLNASASGSTFRVFVNSNILDIGFFATLDDAKAAIPALLETLFQPKYPN